MRLSIANILLLIPGVSFITLADGCSGNAVEIKQTGPDTIRVEEVSDSTRLIEAVGLFFRALLSDD